MADRRDTILSEIDRMASALRDIALEIHANPWLPVIAIPLHTIAACR